MHLQKFPASAAILLLAAVVNGCATLENVVDPPSVSLKSVQLTNIGLKSQTFVLGFDVVNPNPIPLPVASIQYGVSLDGQRFASGETDGAFTIPANGDSDFSISVSLDLMRTAPTLFWLVRDARERDIPYQLDGHLGVDLPFAKPLPFRSSGSIRLSADP